MSPFGIEEHTEPGGRRRLRITGELDLATCSELAARLAAAAERREQVLLDIHDLEFMDSIGLRLLLEAAGEAARDGWNLTITRPPHGAVLRLLEPTRTLGVLSVADPSQPAERVDERGDAPAPSVDPGVGSSPPGRPALERRPL